jgi:hypothetical protein
MTEEAKAMDAAYERALIAYTLAPAGKYRALFEAGVTYGEELGRRNAEREAQEARPTGVDIDDQPDGWEPLHEPEEWR